nr:hypothetical protein [Terrimicrobiaceae bacterium]
MKAARPPKIPVAIRPRAAFATPFRPLACCTQALAACMVLTAVFSGPVHGQIIAEFSGGDSTSVVDAWTGKAGDGWSNAWTRAYTGNFPDSSVKGPASIGYVSLNGTENYLRTGFKSAPASAAGSTIARQYTSYGDVNLADPHEVSFFYRVVQGTTASINDINIGDLNVISTGPYSAVTTWRIGVDPTDSTWRFGNGTNNVGSFWLDSNLSVSVGDIYFFRITIDPASYTYDAYVENVTDNLSFSADGLAFRTNKAVGGYLNFYSSVLLGDPNFIFDMTSLEIAAVPEPGTAALLGAAGLVVVAL